MQSICWCKIGGFGAPTYAKINIKSQISYRCGAKEEWMHHIFQKIIIESSGLKNKLCIGVKTLPY
jgi:hypothetical protein